MPTDQELGAVALLILAATVGVYRFMAAVVEALDYRRWQEAARSYKENRR
jgi:hypothetical protein